MYLSPAYRELKVAGTSTSVFDDLSTRLDECGVEVVDVATTEDGQSVPNLLLICPGVFECAALELRLRRYSFVHLVYAGQCRAPLSILSGRLFQKFWSKRHWIP